MIIKKALISIIKSEEDSDLRDAVSIREHGFRFVINANVVQDTHRYVLVCVITYRKRKRKKKPSERLTMHVNFRNAI